MDDNYDQGLFIMTRFVVHTSNGRWWCGQTLRACRRSAARRRAALETYVRPTGTGENGPQRLQQRPELQDPPNGIVSASTTPERLAIDWRRTS